MTNGEKIITGLICRAISIGFVWLWVALLNPPIVSSLVWLIAILFAEIEVGFLAFSRRS